MHRLSTTLAKYKNTPFQWGETDCCMFSCDCVETITGIDVAEPYRDKYTTETGAKRALSKYGSIEESFDKHFKRIDFNFAKRGDVVLYTSELGKTVGIKWSGGLLTMSHTGVVLVTDFTPEIVWGVQ